MKLSTTILKMILPALIITALALLVGTVDAAPRQPATSGGPFTGTFEGYLYGDRNSRAPVELVLVQKGSEVTGTIVLDRGLVVNAGNCGVVAVPAGSQTAAGQTSSTNLRQIVAEATIEVSGLNVDIELEGEVSRDGETITVTAEIDLPWLCGRDPVISGTFLKAN